MQSLISGAINIRDRKSIRISHRKFGCFSAMFRVVEEINRVKPSVGGARPRAPCKRMETRMKRQRALLA